MITRRFLVVVNPRCGAKRGLAVTAQIEPIFAAAGAELDVCPTEYTGHATQIACTADLAAYDGICVIGGDGTTHEVVAGLMERNDHALIPLGLIPAGTGNALHRHLQGGDPRAAANRIVKGTVRPLDVVRVTMDRQTAYCVNIIGWGAVADINKNAEKLRMLGTHRYALATFAQIVLPRPRRAQVELDGELLEDDFLFVLGCNTKSTGAGMMVAPHAEIDDGLLDVIMLRGASRWEMLKLFTQVFHGSHLSLPSIEYFRVRSLTVKAEACGPLNLDGELKGSSPFRADMMAGVMQVFC